MPAAMARRCVTLLALLASASGCGPIQSTSYLMDAETMLRAARTAQADRFAVYEWTAANLYVGKAREEVGRSEYEQAVDYARKGLDLATQARDAAVKARARAEPPAEIP